MSQAYAFPPDTQIEDPCEGGRCHQDQESGTWLACRKHEAQMEAEPEPNDQPDEYVETFAARREADADFAAGDDDEEDPEGYTFEKWYTRRAEAGWGE